MKDIQIEILVKHKDVAIIPHPAEIFTNYTFSHNQKEYYISKKVYNALQSLFNSYLDAELSENPPYQEFIDEKLSYHSPLPDHIKEYYGKLIIENHGKLENLCSRIHPYAPHDIPKMLNTIWYKNLSGCMAELLEFLKFTILHGPDRDFDKFESRAGYYRERYCGWLNKYFLSDKMKDVYEATSVKKNIEYLQALIDHIDKPLQQVRKAGVRPVPTIETFEDLFKNPEDAEHALSCLRQLDIPVIDADNNYIGRNKGIFKIWIDTLKNYTGGGLIKKYNSNQQLADILNAKISGLYLHSTEFTKEYKRLNAGSIEREFKYFLSQSSQQRKLRK